MNDGERQMGCRYALLIDRCVEERRLLRGTSVVDKAPTVQYTYRLDSLYI